MTKMHLSTYYKLFCFIRRPPLWGPPGCLLATPLQTPFMVRGRADGLKPTDAYSTGTEYEKRFKQSEVQNKGGKEKKRKAVPGELTIHAPNASFTALHCPVKGST